MVFTNPVQELHVINVLSSVNKQSVFGNALIAVISQTHSETCISVGHQH